MATQVVRYGTSVFLPLLYTTELRFWVFALYIITLYKAVTSFWCPLVCQMVIIATVTETHMHTGTSVMYQDKVDKSQAYPCSTSQYICICPLVADSSSDYSQRTGFDLPSLQQEFRTTPEGARRETDDPLPDRIKVQPPLIIKYL